MNGVPCSLQRLNICAILCAVHGRIYLFLLHKDNIKQRKQKQAEKRNQSRDPGSCGGSQQYCKQKAPEYSSVSQNELQLFIPGDDRPFVHILIDIRTFTQRALAQRTCDIRANSSDPDLRFAMRAANNSGHITGLLEVPLQQAFQGLAVAGFVAGHFVDGGLIRCANGPEAAG